MKQTKRKREVALDVAKATAPTGVAIVPAAETQTLSSVPTLPTNAVLKAAENTRDTSDGEMSNSVDTNSVDPKSISNDLEKSPKQSDVQSPLYALGENSTVRDSLTIKSALLDLIMDARPITIDVRPVKRIDTAVLQVLCAFVGDRNAAGGQVRWIGSNEIFCEAVYLLGLKDALGISAELLAEGMS